MLSLTHRALLWAGAVVVLLFGMMLASCKKESAEVADPKVAAKAEMAKADDLWKSDKRENAVEVYTALVNDHFLDLAPSEQARALSHVIDHQVKQAGPDAATDYMQKAIVMNVPLSLTTPEANKALAVEREKSKHNGNPWTDAAAAEKFAKEVDAMEPADSGEPTGQADKKTVGKQASGDPYEDGKKAGQKIISTWNQNWSKMSASEKKAIAPQYKKQLGAMVRAMVDISTAQGNNSPAARRYKGICDTVSAGLLDMGIE